jgi:hypothetical protein
MALWNSLKLFKQFEREFRSQNSQSMRFFKNTARLLREFLLIAKYVIILTIAVLSFTNAAGRLQVIGKRGIVNGKERCSHQSHYSQRS